MRAVTGAFFHVSERRPGMTGPRTDQPSRPPPPKMVPVGGGGFRCGPFLERFFAAFLGAFFAATFFVAFLEAAFFGGAFLAVFFFATFHSPFAYRLALAELPVHLKSLTIPIVIAYAMFFHLAAPFGDIARRQQRERLAESGIASQSGDNFSDPVRVEMYERQPQAIVQEFGPAHRIRRTFAELMSDYRIRRDHQIITEEPQPHTAFVVDIAALQLMTVPTAGGFDDIPARRKAAAGDDRRSYRTWRTTP
jgi:hypothetical protein